MSGGLPSMPGTARALRTLVVDDVFVNRELLRLLVEQQGHAAELADSGAAAVARVAAGGIDLVFMDVAMPELDGLEATRRIRRLPGAAGRTPVWAVTAQTQPHEIARCLDAGMDGHIGKPVSAQLLRSLLEGVRRLGEGG